MSKNKLSKKDCFDKLDNNNLKNILSKNINIYLL